MRFARRSTSPGRCPNGHAIRRRRCCEQTTQLLFDHSLFNGHPRFFGYITVVAGADRDARRPYRSGGEPERRRLGACRRRRPRSSRQTVRWIAALIGYPADCGGLLVSGGNMANFVWFLAARAAKAGHVYASAETHTWIQKAADLSGIGSTAIRWILSTALPNEPQFRLHLNGAAVASALERREALNTWTVGRDDTPAERMELESGEDEDGFYVAIDGLGKVRGTARIYETELTTSGKAGEQGRSPASSSRSAGGCSTSMTRCSASAPSRTRPSPASGWRSRPTGSTTSYARPARPCSTRRRSNSCAST